MQKLYFEQEQTKNANVKIINSRLSLASKIENNLSIDEMRYALRIKLKDVEMPKKFWIYINNVKLTLTITEQGKPSTTPIDKEILKKILVLIFGDTNYQVFGSNGAYLKNNSYTRVLRKLTVLLNRNRVIDIETGKEVGADQAQEQTQTGKPQAEEKPAEQTENKVENKVKIEDLTIENEELNKTAEIILKNIKSTKRMLDIDGAKIKVDFNKPISGETVINVLYVKYLTYLYLLLSKKDVETQTQSVLNNTKLKEIIKKISEINKKSKNGLPPKTFIDQIGSQIFGTLPNAEAIKEIKDKKQIFFEDEIIDFFKELKNTDLFLERYLKG